MKRKLICIGIIGMFLLTSATCISAFSIETKLSNVDIENIGKQQSLLGDPPEVEWDKIYGGPEDELSDSSVEQTTDGGYIIVGSTESYGSGSSDIWIIKTDENGTEQWTKTYGGTDYEIGEAVQQTEDGGYIIFGYTKSYGEGKYDAWLIRLDSNGNEQWTKTIGDSFINYLMDGCQTTDGGFIFTGATYTSHSGLFADLWLVKTDANGNVEWEKTFDKSDIDIGLCVKQTDDGGYIIACPFDSYLWYANTWLIKTDSNGNLVWDKTFGEQFWGALFRLMSLEQTIDGGYILAGSRNWQDNIYDHGYWLVKTDSNGNEEWSKTIPNTHGWLDSIRQTDNGEYIMIGFNAPTHNLDVIKAYENGNEKWSTSFGENGRFFSREVELTDDGGYIFIGSFLQSGSDNYDIRVIKLEGENLPPNVPPSPPVIDGPASGKVGVEYEYTFAATDDDGDDVYLYIDWDDDTFEEWIGPYASSEEVKVNHTWDQRGTYIIKAKARDTYDAESNWGILEVTMPRNKIVSGNQLVQRILQQFPNAFSIFHQLLGL